MRTLVSRVAGAGGMLIVFVQVDSAIGGMRGMKALFWESSIVDPNEVRLARLLVVV